MELKIPYAVNAVGRLVDPRNAERSCEYKCPQCRELVVFRCGAKRRNHFAHKASELCNQETMEHLVAKRLIKQVIDEWLEGGVRPVFVRKCVFCGYGVNQPIPDKVNGAVLEKRLPEGVIVDVALLNGEKTIAAVEIRFSHKVGEKKISMLSVPFIELDAINVCKNPFVWEEIVGTFKPSRCEECKNALQNHIDKCEKLGREYGMMLPSSFYRYGVGICWKCGRSILVFAWPAWKEDHKLDRFWKEPRPRTIKYRYSKTMGKNHWVNTCPCCGRNQGGYFLYHVPEEAFYGLDRNLIDDHQAFIKDLTTIAITH